MAILILIEKRQFGVSTSFLGASHLISEPPATSKFMDLMRGELRLVVVLLCSIIMDNKSQLLEIIANLPFSPV